VQVRGLGHQTGALLRRWKPRRTWAIVPHRPPGTVAVQAAASSSWAPGPVETPAGHARLRRRRARCRGERAWLI